MSTYAVAFFLGGLLAGYPCYLFGVHRALRHLGSAEYRKRKEEIEAERARTRLHL
jgi:hypothetical protein